MNELSETNRNIGLLEQSIHMTSSPSQADAADYMICEETGRKRQIISHLHELLQESHERSSEVYALYKSATEEESYYTERVKHFQAARDFANADACMELKTKAAMEGTKYLQEYSKLNELALSISNTIRGEQSPRLLPLTKNDGLPFENESAKEISRERFNQILMSLDAAPTVEQYTGKDLETVVSDINEGYRHMEIMVCSALGSQVWEHEDLTDDEKTAFEAALVQYFSDVEEVLEEKVSEANLPSQRRINANIGIRA